MQSAPTSFEHLDQLLGHPVTLLFGAVVAAWLAARVVHEQVRRLRLDESDGRAPPFDWPALFAALVFWLVLALGVYGLASHRGLAAVAKVLEGGVSLVLRVLLGAVVVAGASRLGRTLTATRDAGEEELAAGRRERRAVLVAGAVLAAAAVTGLSPAACLVLALVAAPIGLLLRHPEHRARVAGWLADLAAGLRLRELEPERRARDGLSVKGEIGLLRTWVVEGERAHLVRNEALLERLTA
ncbi:MAG: hypothetical protein KF878_01675 [Planctomycetes bacterium]|nr:hypothetical protein [Planctomycetota bacterium]